MPLSKESEDALRRCLRILAPRSNATGRAKLIQVIERSIAQGRWPSTIAVDELRALWFADDPARQAKFKILLERAVAEGELPKGGVYTASHLAAWVSCPAVPEDSPLIHWLPDWMQKLEPLVIENETVAEKNDAGRSKSEILAARWPLPTNVNLERLLSDVPRWLKPARTRRGKRGGDSSRWDPTMLAVCITNKYNVPKQRLDKVMQTYFPESVEEWRGKSEYLD